MVFLTTLLTFQGLDIGDVHHIENFCGAARTVTSLVVRMLNLNMEVPSLMGQLQWFKGQEHHFVIQFSDDGAPEAKDTTMTIGSLTLWNVGSRARSREYHYLLHTISCKEKEDVAFNLWQQHTDEMRLLEGNTLTIAGNQVTVEFQPSADQAWQVMHLPLMCY